MKRTTCKCGHQMAPDPRAGRNQHCPYCNTVRSYAQKQGLRLGEYYAKHPRMLTEYFTHLVSRSNGRV